MIIKDSWTGLTRAVLRVILLTPKATLQNFMYKGYVAQPPFESSANVTSDITLPHSPKLRIYIFPNDCF
jgi:hypothetical protein